MDALRPVPRAYRRRRPLLVFASDVHLTDSLGQPHVPWELTFGRFWERIDAARGEEPAELCIVGDFFDIVRSPRWFLGKERPYHEPGPEVAAVVEAIVAATVERERGFFGAIRAQVERGALRVHYLLGNHDRLLAHAPGARRRAWRALTGEDREVDLPSELVFAEHGALAYHGHTGDFICSSRDGSAPVSDMFGAELIVRFPDALRARLGHDLPHLDDIDDVRPIYAVPAWIRQIGEGERGLGRPVAEVWSGLVEEFLDNDHVKTWMRSQRRVGGLDPGSQLRGLLQLSTGPILAKAADSRLTRLFGLMQQLFDGRFQERAARRLQRPDYKGLRSVVNGHSHFAAMTPLGHVQGKPTCYFNTGTWRTVHQIGTRTLGRPSFLPVQAMSYVCFFPDGDPMARDFEWWTGAMVARHETLPAPA